MLNAHLCLAVEKEFVRVNAVANSVADEWEQMEHQRRFMGIAEQELLKDVDYDCDNYQCCHPRHQNRPGGGTIQAVSQRADESREKTHKLIDGLGLENRWWEEQWL